MSLLPAFLSGLLLGGSLIVAIGAQNAFLLRQGLIRAHVFILCLICALSDALLIAAGVAGLGTLVAASPALMTAATFGGAAFLAVYAALAFRRAAHPHALKAGRPESVDLRTAVLTCLAFTFLNPHVYLDTVLLVGSLSGQYDGAARIAFGAGAAIASFIWFFSLGYGARLLTPLFAKPTAWCVLDVLIGIVMASLALGLVLNFIRTA